MAPSISEETWLSIISSPAEASSVEFKSPGLFEALKDKIVKAALGLANLQDGGFIIIGVEEVAKVLTHRGLTKSQLESFNVDAVAAHINTYATPGIVIDISEMIYQERSYKVIRVAQFADVPIVCRRNFPDDKVAPGESASHGRIYARALTGKPESRPATPDDLREILDLAVRIRIARLQRMCVGECSYSRSDGPIPSDAAKLDLELGEI